MFVYVYVCVFPSALAGLWLLMCNELKLKFVNFCCKKRFPSFFLFSFQVSPGAGGIQSDQGGWRQEQAWVIEQQFFPLADSSLASNYSSPSIEYQTSNCMQLRVTQSATSSAIFPFSRPKAIVSNYRRLKLYTRSMAVGRYAILLGKDFRRFFFFFCGDWVRVFHSFFVRCFWARTLRYLFSLNFTSFVSLRPRAIAQKGKLGKIIFILFF